MTELWFIRHGETQWNIETRFQGAMNSDLTPRGIRQAERIGERLRSAHLHQLFSSDLGRAWQTAEVIGTLIDLKPAAEPCFRERNLGVFEGLTDAEMRQRFPAEHATFLSWDPDYVVPGGESGTMFRQRVEPGLSALLARYPGQRLGIVTHGGVLDLIFRMAFDLPLSMPRRWSLFNASLSRFRVQDGNWRLDAWGDVSHLEMPDSADGTVRSL